jgi:hypothetical protein
MSMSATTVPEIPLVPITLEARELLGGVQAGVAHDLRRISFGRANPVAVTSLTPDIDDPELRRDLERDQDHRFFSLTFTCSFRPDDEPLLESRLAIHLSTEQADGGGDSPIARLLQPFRLAKPIKRHTGFNFVPSVTVPGMGVQGVGWTRQDDIPVDDAYVVADGKGEATAEWFFRATAAVALEGMHDLRLIAQAPRGVPAVAELIMTAKIRRRLAGIVPYRAALPECLRTIPLPA